MPSTQTDRIFGLSSSVAVKAPCRVATVGSDISSTLASGGLITLDGITLNTNDRVLVKDQTTQSQNGIYLASTSPWVRDADADGNNDLVQGSLVYITSGTLNGNTWWQQATAGTITVGTTNLVFSQVNMSPGFTATSTTSLTVGAGSTSLTVQQNKSFVAGQFVTIADTAAPGTNYMWGAVTSYAASTGALVVNVTVTAGSGTKTAWNVSVVGAQGVTGPTGATGPAGNLTNTGTPTVGQIPKYSDTTGNAVVPGYTVGTAANNIPQLNGSAKLPAVDGSQLTNLPGIPGFVNILRGNSLSSWENGTTGTITTAGGWAASGVYVIPTGASVGFARLTAQQPGYYALQLQGATGVTGIKVRFVVESNQGATLAQHLQATFQITAYQSSGGSVTPTITVKHAGAQDNWASPVTDVSAQNMTALANAAQQVTAYTFNVSGGMSNGVEVEVDFGNNWGASGKNILIYAGFDLRAAPGVATGINTSPPTPEIRDPQSDIAWCQRFLASSYQNGTTGGTPVSYGVGGSACVASSTAAPVFIEFPVPLRTAPASIFWWDVNGNASKVSTLALGTTSTFAHNAAAAAAPGSISENGFIFVGANVAAASFINYVADVRIIGG